MEAKRRWKTALNLTVAKVMDSRGEASIALRALMQC